jgi:nucleoside-diphosphate-sugar epimerase
MSIRPGTDIVMNVLVIGAAGMLGRKLSAALIARGLGGRPVTALTLADVTAPAAPPGAPAATRCIAADIAQPGEAETLTAGRPDVIFHLAAIVSGEAEADFEKGYRVNFDGTRALFEAIRHAGEGWKPRLVFASSVAVFGGPYPDSVPDEFFPTPHSSYGTQKAMAELLLNDYSRRGFFDGIALRLPTICIRPGAPNRAASGFFSSILREPLNGQEAVLPVPDSLRHWFASPRAATGFFLHAATLDTARLEGRRALNMPGLSATVAEEIAALGRAAGPEAAARIQHVPDPAIMAIVRGWPARFDASRARALGFQAETGMDEIIAVYREDEMGASPR